VSKYDDPDFWEAQELSREADLAARTDRMNKVLPGRKFAPADFVYDPLKVEPPE
jgi:hypothetical protein